MLFTALGKSVAAEISERRLVRMSNFSPSLSVIFAPTSNFVGTTPVTTIRFSFSSPFKISRIFPFLSMQIYLSKCLTYAVLTHSSTAISTVAGNFSLTCTSFISGIFLRFLTAERVFVRSMFLPVTMPEFLTSCCAVRALFPVTATVFMLNAGVKRSDVNTANKRHKSTKLFLPSPFMFFSGISSFSSLTFTKL